MGRSNNNKEVQVELASNRDRMVEHIGQRQAGHRISSGRALARSEVT